MIRTRKHNHAPRKISWRPFVLILASLALVCATGQVIPMGSPRKMVAALAVHGDPIAPVPNRQTTNASSATDAAPEVKSASSNAPSTSPVPEKTPVTGHSQHYLRVTFTQLSGFQFPVTDELVNPTTDLAQADQKVREQIPDPVWKLSEKDISLTGYMLPVQLKNGLATDFMLLPNQMTCCYGVKPRINEWVIVRTSGKGVKPIMDTLVTAEGTLHVGAQRENGSLTGIYQLDLDQLKTPTNN